MISYILKSKKYEVFNDVDLDDDGTDVKVIVTENDETSNERNIYLQKFYQCGTSLKRNWKCVLCITVVLSIIMTSIILIYIFFRPCVAHNYTEHIKVQEYNYCEKDNNNRRISPVSPSEFNTSNVHKIVLYGDSQISITNRLYKIKDRLADKITTRFPHLNFTVTSEARSGQHISDLRKRMCKDVIDQGAEAVIMFWDSDVTSRQDHQSMSAIKAYVNYLSEIMATMRAEVNYFAVAGPSLQGELPDGKNKNDQCLDIYEQINRNLSTIYNITYIDVRRIFMKYDRTTDWHSPSGYLTMDGQHPSYAGFLLLTELFFNQLEKWYENVLI